MYSIAQFVQQWFMEIWMNVILMWTINEECKQKWLQFLLVLGLNNIAALFVFVYYSLGGLDSRKTNINTPKAAIAMFLNMVNIV